jgi:outer membrane protein
MKRFWLLSAVIMVSCLIAMPALAAKDVKIGVIDTQKILREAKAAKSAQAILQKDAEEKRTQLTAKEKEVQRLDGEVKKAVSDKEKREKGAKLNQAAKEYKRLETDLNEDINKKLQELRQKLINDIRDVVKTFAKSKDYTREGLHRHQ